MKKENFPSIKTLCCIRMMTVTTTWISLSLLLIYGLRTTILLQQIATKANLLQAKSFPLSPLQLRSSSVWFVLSSIRYVIYLGLLEKYPSKIILPLMVFYCNLQSFLSLYFLDRIYSSNLTIPQFCGITDKRYNRFELSLLNEGSMSPSYDIMIVFIFNFLTLDNPRT